MPIKKIRDDLGRILHLRKCERCKLTFEEIGRIFGVTKQRIKQIVQGEELSTDDT